jgi:PhoPQ-activated pathogenicity-related protein
MKSRQSFTIAAGLAGLALASAEHAGPSPLSDYVYAPEPVYGYTLMETIDGPGYSAHVLLMNALEWRTPQEVDRTLWSHQVVIIVPDVVTATTGLLLVNGGSDPLDPVDPLVIELGAPIAVLTGSVLAAVSQIPNQPLLFPDEAEPISEDALVAYSWDKAMDTGDASWAAYLPMTKASVRALDAVQDFLSARGRAVTDFVVTGFSKRGATAWLVAAVDPRVRAVAPGVFDILDMALQIERHYEAYGFYAPAITDYVHYDIVGRTRSPEGRFLTSIVDPLSYAKLLAMPKLVLVATGDQFFLPDSANHYVDRLPGETLVRQVPNTDHGFTNAELQVFFDLLGWYQTVLQDVVRPQIAWRFEGDGTLVVTSDQPPLSAQLWQATNPDARDFRLETFGPQWSSTPLAAKPDGSYRVQVPAPPAGWTGYLVQLAYPGPSGTQQTYGTPVQVTPATLPFALDDPLLDPRTAWYWGCQVAGERCPQPPDYDEDELEALLPFPVFGEYVDTIDDLAELIVRGDDPVVAARRACTVTRLNVATHQAGWYTPLDLGPVGSGLLWELYQDAEDGFANGDAHTAEAVCSRINAR